MQNNNLLNPAGNSSYSSAQLTALVILRVLIGWHFLYEGISKVLNPNWSSIGFLLDSKGIFAGVFHSLAASQDMVALINFMNIWGLILIGLALISGLFTRIGIISGMVLLALYYLSHPPLISAEYAIPSEGSYLWVNKNLIEFFALWVLYLFPGSKHIGLDRFIFRNKSNN
ncbi:MAG: DoxX family membrane protein [Bacteroidales bacterium]|nr:DoxX family membrane protein [Bacteroidales bacterium]MCB9014153.1 DoxX family membrane protein [Bacteroidales bacterium]